MPSTAHTITRLLARWRRGDRTALDRLVPLIEGELKRIAQRHLQRERQDHALQASSLVQEAFVRLLPGGDVEWEGRAHFLAVASTVMRHVLVDHARSRRRLKRGGAAAHVPLDSNVALTVRQLDEVVAIDIALERLATADARKSKVLEMRLFGGLSVKETAQALGISENTVLRDWNFARAWLRRELGGDESRHATLAAD